MTEDDSNGEDEVVESGEGSAGEPEELDAEAAAQRSEDLGLVPKHELDERQEKLGTTRRRGGPDLHTETRSRDEAVEEAPDVEPTETEEEDGEPA